MTQFILHSYHNLKEISLQQFSESFVRNLYDRKS